MKLQQELSHQPGSADVEMEVSLRGGQGPLGRGPANGGRGQNATIHLIFGKQVEGNIKCFDQMHDDELTSRSTRNTDLPANVLVSLLKDTSRTVGPETAEARPYRTGPAFWFEPSSSRRSADTSA